MAKNSFKNRYIFQCYFILVILVSALSIPAWAEDSSSDSIQDRLGQLEREIAELKSKPPSEATAKENPNWYDYIVVGGYLDMSMTYNFQSPAIPAVGLAAVNSMRIFDTNAVGFRFHTFELTFEENQTYWPDWLGFRVDFDVGLDPPVYTSAGFFGADDVELQQAFIKLGAPWANGLKLQIGKWATLLGAEVIESKDNFNFSRSFMFGFAIPFTHLGVLATYPLIEDQLSVSVGIVNGWDRVNDTNSVPSYIGQIAYTPVEQFHFFVSGIAGPEDPFGFGNDSDYRGVIDLVAVIKPIPRLTFLLNYDWGRESGVIFQGFPFGPFRHAEWQGFSGIVAYDFTDWFQLAFRGEYFRDPDGYRTVGALQPAFPLGAFFNNHNLWETTLTSTFKIYKSLHLRLEYRHDQSSLPVFVKDVIAVDHQDTVSTEVFLSF